MRKLKDQQLKEILAQEGYVSLDDIEDAAQYEKSGKGSFLEYLLTEGMINNDILGQAIAEFYNVPYADLNSNKPSREQVLLIPEDVAKMLHIVLFKNTEKEITIVTDDPKQKDLAISLKKLFPQKKVTVAYSLSEDIESVFIYYRKGLNTRFSEIIASEKRIAPEIVEEIINDALTFRSSDVHFEPQEKEVLIRFRIDGVLQEAGRIPKKIYENILNRIKILAKMRIDEHTSAQDGAMRIEQDGVTIDMRVSIVPAVNGEKVVIRILAEYIKGFNLNDIGFSAKSQEQIEKAAHRPFGMVLVTGPTGSGKTTTLYSLLKLRNKPDVNITTIEDPVEYRIAGANQIQVRTDSGLSFARGLRSIVRQDPDIILVGEIRDGETAEIAVNAALTGHLLFSTFHANDAATTIPRLIEMGVEPFLLSSTLELIVAQRLVRKICDHCKASYVVKVSDLEKQYAGIGEHIKGKEVTLYKGDGCTACSDSGYLGRTAIFELIPLNEEIRNLILTSPSGGEIEKLARKTGAETLFDDGMEKVVSGVTTLEELLRLVAPPA